MTIKEDFSRKLDEAFWGKQRVDQEMRKKENLEKIRRGLEWQEREKSENERMTLEGEREKQRNEELRGMSNQVQVKQYLEALGEKIAPKQNVKEWGPENGMIAFSLTYNKKWSVISVSSHQKLISPGTSNKGGGSAPVYGTEIEEGLRLVEKVLAVRINDWGELGVFSKACANSPFYERDRNPLSWQFGRNVQYTRGFGYYAKKEMVWEWEKGVLLKTETNPEGLQQFAQTLTNFYVGLKTGQIK